MLGYISQKKLSQMFDTVRVPWHGIIVKVYDQLGWDYMTKLSEENRCKCSILRYWPLTNAQKEIARSQKAS